MAFSHALHLPSDPKPDDRCLVLQGSRLLARPDPTQHSLFASVGELKPWLQRPLLPLGILEGRPCWFLSTEPSEAPAPEGWQWLETRPLLSLLTPVQLHAISTALELSWWSGRNRFCGHCGAPTAEVQTERAMRCTRCGTLFYPNPAPAVIVAVTRGDSILLAHNKNFAPGLFSLIAGFVDPGETLEQAAAREVREETGLSIKNLRYLVSQPWPFPNSLMLAFQAEYATGEIAVDGHEIETAGWFKASALPDIPRKGTVARRVIDAWLANPADQHISVPA